MTEETRTIISNIIAGVDITPENLLIAKKALDEKLIRDKATTVVDEGGDE